MDFGGRVILVAAKKQLVGDPDQFTRSGELGRSLAIGAGAFERAALHSASPIATSPRS